MCTYRNGDQEISAENKLSPQFLTLFHGTTDERADSIARTGFKFDYGGYGLKEHNIGATWGTMSTDKDSAGSYVATVDHGQRVPTKGQGSVVKFRIPAEHQADLVNPVDPKYQPGVYAVRRDIPPEYVAGVHRSAQADKQREA